MKLLMNADTLGGVWTYAVDLCRALAEHDVEIILATTGRLPSDEQRSQAEALDNVTLESSDHPLEWMPGDPWPGVDACGQWLLEMADHHRPDVVHLNDYAHGALPFDAPVLTVGHSCVISWWHATLGEAPPAEYETYRRRVADGLAGADLVAAPTQAMLDELVRHYGVAGATAVVPNGRAATVEPQAHRRDVILAAGRLWDEAKNIAILAEAADGLAWPVEVAGDATHPQGHELSFPNVRALGPLASEELRRRMSSAAIYCLPARYEPFGLSILEAAQAGCCLVLGDIPSLREVWGDAAVFLEPRDADGLRATLEGLINDPARRERLAQRAHERAKRYVPERMAREYVMLYRQLVAPQQNASQTTPLRVGA